MTITFSINETLLPSEQVTEFHIISDIYTFTPRIVLSLSNDNVIRLAQVGADLTGTLRNDEGAPIVVAHFYITDVEGKPSEGGTPGRYDNVIVKGRHLTEISDSRTRGFFGPVSSVMIQALQDQEMANFTDYDIEQSSDIARLRYQTADPISQFLQELAPYGVSDGSPMYLWTDIFGVVHFRSRRSLSSAPPKFLINYFGSPSPSTPIDNNLTELVAATGSINFSSIDSADTRLIGFQTHTFETAKRADVPSQLTLNTSSQYEMNKVWFYYDWTLSPYEGAARALNDHQRREDRLQEVIVAIQTVTGVAIGDVVYHNGPSATGYYLVTYLDYLSTGEQLLTKLVLTRIGERSSGR